MDSPLRSPRPVRRPLPPTAAAPTLIRPPRDTSLFRGWGVTL
jgi:hypothetical protein